MPGFETLLVVVANDLRDVTGKARANQIPDPATVDNPLRPTVFQFLGP
jgi:hypothetical protein